MKKMKQILALTLCVLMACSGPLGVFAEEAAAAADVTVCETCHQEICVCDELGNDTEDVQPDDNSQAECNCETTDEIHADTCPKYVASEPAKVCETCQQETCIGDKAGDDSTEIEDDENKQEECNCETTDEIHAETCPKYTVSEEDEQTASELSEEDNNTVEENNVEEKEIEEVSLKEQLVNAQNISEMYALVLEVMNSAPDKLLALTAEEISELRIRINELDPEGTDVDTQDLLDTLDVLPANACPECGELAGHTVDCVKNIQMLPSSGNVEATTISNNQTWNLTGDITLTGTIRIESGATLKIYNHVNNTATRTIKRGGSFTGDMFVVENGGTLHINGYDWNEGEWNSGPIVLDGNASVTATGQIIDCSGKLSLRDAVIRNNKGYTGIWLGGNGDGTPVDQYHYTTIEITRVFIENCSASSGGGIFIENTTGSDYTVEIWNSKFSKCTAIDASAIYFHGDGQAVVDMKTSVVEDCDTTKGGDGQYGGALRTNGNGRYKFTMTDSIVRNCDSWKFGGGIYWNASGSGSELIVEDCQFLNNSAVEMGGGMFLEGSNMIIKASAGTPTDAITSGMPGQIIGTLIQNNESANGGGVSYKCYSNDPNVQVPTTVANFNENVIFNNNEGTYGAALAYNLHDTHNYPEDAEFTFNINGAEFTNNVSTEAGGAIYVIKCREDYVCTVNFNSGTVTKNTAKNGGAIAITTSSDVTTGGTFNMKGGTLSNNTASASGGAVYLENGNFNMSGGIAENNNAKNGGSAYVTGGDFTMSGGEMKKNESTENGGAVYLSGGDFRMSNGSINNNVANTNGGAAYVAGGNVTIEHGTINGNKATGKTETTGNGGAIYMSSANATLKMESGSMSNNEAANDGGAIYANGGTILIGLEGCSTESAGAKCNHHTDKGAGRHHPIINANKAGDTGGGIALKDGVVRFYCGAAKDNLALYKGVGKNVFMDGGEFYLYDGADIGIPRDPDLVIVGGKLYNECDKKEYVYLYYYENNTKNVTDMVGLAEYKEIMNLPDGEYFWDAPEGYVFLGWTAQGAASGNQNNGFVRNKEQYVNSGEPVEILDQLTTGSDQTAVNTNRVFDGTTDADKKIMHLYALWAPKTSRITYVNGLTGTTISNTDSDPDNPAAYTFCRESNKIQIQPVKYPGYDLVGWYIYQDVDQNANWNDTQADYDNKKYEPNYTGTDYSNQKVYHKLDSRNGVLELEAGYTNFGNITLIADYELAYRDLKITKSGANEVLDPDQTFIFKVTGDAYVDGTGQEDNDSVDIEMEVAINGNGTVTIAHLPVGDYEVTELTGWSWRYAPDDIYVEEKPWKEKQPVRVELNNSQKEVRFENNRNNPYWMDGNSHVQNIFTEKSVTRFPKEQEGGK